MNPTNLSTKRQWIAELARRKPGEVLYSLHHVIDLEWMQEAYALTRKDGATGIDGVTATEYEANLEANLSDLLERIKSGRYKAPPVRRTYIPKADSTQCQRTSLMKNRMHNPARPGLWGVRVVTSSPTRPLLPRDFPMMLQPAMRSNRQIRDSLRSCTTPRGRALAKYRKRGPLTL